MSSEVSNFNIIFDIGKVLLFTILTIIIFAFIYWVIAQNNNNAFKDLNPNDNFIKFIYFYFIYMVYRPISKNSAVFFFG